MLKDVLSGFWQALPRAPGELDRAAQCGGQRDDAALQGLPDVARHVINTNLGPSNLELNGLP